MPILIMRFPSDVKAALRKAAEAERHSMSNLTFGILVEWLEARNYLPARPQPKRTK